MKFRPAWTGNLVAEMHLSGVTAKELAAEVGWNPKYLSAVLNGRREPKGAEYKLCAALLRLEIKKDRRAKGLSDDLIEMLRRECSPAYAARLKKYLGLTGQDASG